MMFGGQSGTGPGFPTSNFALCCLSFRKCSILVFHSSSVDDIEYDMIYIYIYIC